MANLKQTDKKILELQEHTYFYQLQCEGQMLIKTDHRIIDNF